MSSHHGIFHTGPTNGNAPQSVMSELSTTPAPALVVPSTTWRTLADQNPAETLPRGLDATWDMARGFLARCRTRTSHFIHQAQQVLALDNKYKDLTDAKIREAADEMRALFRTHKDTPETLLHAVAIVREVAWRKLGEKHYLVQVAGALAMHHGAIAEMATGEGKTLTATIPATLAGWKGKGCHVITVNDYLAKRDAEWMSQIYTFCGLKAGYVEGPMKPPDRKAAYLADITYCTNKEVCADFSRDRLTLGKLRDLPSALLGKILQGAGTDRLVMRGLHYAIIDEADSVLIDEAVTPLIISGDVPNTEQVEAYKQAAQIASQLQRNAHYRLNNRYREVEFTDAGLEQLDALADPLGGVWSGYRRREELVNQALVAREYYLNGKQYVLQDDKEKEGQLKVVIVDEFTGRLMPDRTWRDGLHQAVEAKEQILVNPPKDTFSRISFQRFFRYYDHLCGMTGTGREATREMWQIYHLPVVLVPTHRPCIRQRLPDRVFATESAKWAAIVQDIKRVHATGRPILIGTRSVGASERLSELLTAEHLPHQVLNAVRHAEEAQIVAQAGQLNRITVATNMAGRGTDIKLGKNIKDLGGLHVIATERHESGRVDRQLFGRAGRQGDPGSAQAYVSLEDELLVRYAPRVTAMLRKRHRQVMTELHGPLVSRIANIAQGKAQRNALSQRKAVLRSDDYLDESLGFAGSER